MQILIIDNDLEVLDELTQIILNIDPLHDITTCHSSFDALTRIRKHKYDIVICEVYLQGGVQGNHIIEEVRKGTFKVGMADVLENPLIRMPFNHFWIKPVTEANIREVLNQARFNREYGD